MIADGKIKIKQGVEIERLTEKGILFKDGEEKEADIIVLATGYSSQRTTIAKIIGDEVAKNVGGLWGQDSQGEIPGVWRNSGVPRFYLQSGNLFQARCFSYVHSLLCCFCIASQADSFPFNQKTSRSSDPHDRTRPSRFRP